MRTVGSASQASRQADTRSLRSLGLRCAEREHVRARAKAIDLADGENVDNEEIGFKRGVITGRVTDASGKPLVEQRVQLTRLDDRGQRRARAWLQSVRQFDR